MNQDRARTTLPHLLRLFAIVIVTPLLMACQPILLEIENSGPQAIGVADDEIAGEPAASIQTVLPSLEPTAKVESTTNPEPVPDYVIVFESANLDYEDLDIIVADADVSNTVNITKESRANELLPSWSPDGKRIVFVSDRDGDSEIYTMDPDGSDVIRLTHDPSSDFTPTWLPDGRIGFISDRDDYFYDIYVMNVDGSNVIRLTATYSEEMAPIWSPDGSRIAFISDRDGNSEIYVMNIDGSEVQNLTDHPASDFEPAWSPDGTQILFTSDREGQSDIFTMSADGTNVTRVAAHPAADYAGTWSPDGTQILFTSARNGGQTLYRMTIGENRAERLDGHLNIYDSDPNWLHRRELLPLPATPLQNATIEPITDFDLVSQEFESSFLGLTVNHPLGWFAADNTEMAAILIADDFEKFRQSEESALEESIGLVVFPLEYGNPLEIINDMPQRISGITEMAGAVQQTSVNGREIAVAEYFANSMGDGSPIYYFIAVVTGDSRSATAFTSVRVDRADEVRPIFEGIAKSIQFVD